MAFRCSYHGYITRVDINYTPTAEATRVLQREAADHGPWCGLECSATRQTQFGRASSVRVESRRYYKRSSTSAPDQSLTSHQHLLFRCFHLLDPVNHSCIDSCTRISHTL